jgi:tetratricopeptide (TPR) repeat protein
MKSKRRHELQTNVLADQLGHWIEQIKPYTTHMLLIVAVGAVILAAWVFWTSGAERAQAQAWRSYLLAGSNPQGDIVAELNLVADDFHDTRAGLWAAQTAADIEAAQGVRLLFNDRASGETNLTLAKSRYRDVLDNKLTAKLPLLRLRAHFGLAQAHEALGELEDAKKHYASVVESDPDSAVGQTARHRLDRLELPATARWYNWFERQKPLPRDLGSGLPAGELGMDSFPPLDLGQLPDPPATDPAAPDPPITTDPDLYDLPAPPQGAESPNAGDDPATNGDPVENQPQPNADQPVEVPDP